MKGSATKENGLSNQLLGGLKKPSCGQGDKQYLAGGSGEDRSIITEFQQTEIGEFPKTWKVERVDSAFEIQQGKQVSKKNREGDNQLPFLRTKNVFWNRLDLSDLDQMNFTETEETRLELQPNDLLVCEGGSIGRTALWNAEIDGCLYQNHLHRLRVKGEKVEPQYGVYWLWYAFDIAKLYFGRGNVTTIPNLSRSKLAELPMALPPLPEQKKIAHILSTVQRAIQAQEKIIQTTTELKKALMRKLFTEGIRNEPQKQTEIGPIPESWEVLTVESVCAIKASAMSYKQLEDAPSVPQGICVIGVKVSDMNLPGNEIEFRSANLERLLSEKEALKWTVPENSIVFPKRGAAIATNKKRLTTGRTVLDPNLIAVMPSEAVNHRYLFHWFNTFDLRNITDPGPTPQLNKKDIAPLKFPMPPLAEQEANAVVIDAAEEKTTLHRRKRDQLKVLFRTLLHELMTAKVRVHDLKLINMRLTI